MQRDDLIALRLRNQRLTRTALRQPAEVVAWLGAVQAQDFATAKWGVGLRTHAMRPTWHFVTPADIRWIQRLTAPRVHAANGPTIGARDSTAPRSQKAKVLERALRDETYLTRAEVAQAFGRAGIKAKGVRLAYLMIHAELECVICSGLRRGKQFTYALLDERAPSSGRTVDREESLAELTRRYSPVTARPR